MCTNSVTWFCAYLCKTEDTMNYACCNIWCTTCGLLWPLSANISKSAQVFIFCFQEIFPSIVHILKTQLVSIYHQLYFLPPLFCFHAHLLALSVLALRYVELDSFSHCDLNVYSEDCCMWGDSTPTTQWHKIPALLHENNIQNPWCRLLYLHRCSRSLPSQTGPVSCIPTETSASVPLFFSATPTLLNQTLALPTMAALPLRLTALSPTPSPTTHPGSAGPAT